MKAKLVKELIYQPNRKDPVTAEMVLSWARGSTMMAPAAANTATYNVGDLVQQINEYLGHRYELVKD